MLLTEEAALKSRVGCRIAVPERPTIPGVAKLSPVPSTGCACSLSLGFLSEATGACTTEGFTSVEVSVLMAAELVFAGVPRAFARVPLPAVESGAVLSFAPRRRTMLPLSSCTSNRSIPVLKSHTPRQIGQLPELRVNSDRDTKCWVGCAPRDLDSAFASILELHAAPNQLGWVECRLGFRRSRLLRTTTDRHTCTALRQPFLG